MARLSADARAAATLNVGGKPPSPPARLSKEAKDLWNALVASKPIDWFDQGAQVLLAIMCNEVVRSHELEDRRDEVMNLKVTKLEDRARKERMLKSIEQRLDTVNSAIKTSCVKLRLSVQANIGWHSGRKDERSAGHGKGKRKSNPLLGGRAMWDSTDGKVN
jgi:hypothetical protein